MTKSRPLVQEIRDRFDHFDETIGDRSRTSSIKVASDQHGYSVTSYPAGTYGYEGFTADVRAPQGVFGEHGPTRVEMSREKDGIMRFTFGDMTTDENGMTTANITLEPQAAREGLLLPGDAGFELFDQLHAELATRRAIVADALGTIGITVNPTVLKYTSQTTSAGHYDHENNIATHERGTLLEVGGMDASADDYVYVHVKLDGSLTAPMHKGQPVGYPPEDPMVFRAGTAEADWKYSYRHEHPPVGDEALLAFAGLHASFTALYR
jgi:hypothetical protein